MAVLDNWQEEKFRQILEKYVHEEIWQIRIFKVVRSIQKVLLDTLKVIVMIIITDWCYNLLGFEKTLIFTMSGIGYILATNMKKPL